MWQMEKPIICDVCRNKLVKSKPKVFYDFKTKMGPWCIGCESCFKKVGVGLGNGKGQKYNLETLEETNH